MVNFSNEWKRPLLDYELQLMKGVNRRRALRFIKKKYKFNQSEYKEFVSRAIILI